MRACRPFLPVLASGKLVAGHRGQAERVVEFPVGQQSGVGGDDRTTELEHQAAIEIEPENLPESFHPPGSSR